MPDDAKEPVHRLENPIDNDENEDKIIVCQLQEEISVFINGKDEVSICFRSHRGIENIVSIPLDCVRPLADALKSMVDAEY